MDEVEKLLNDAWDVAMEGEPKTAGCGQLDLADSLLLNIEIDEEKTGELLDVPDDFCSGFKSAIAFVSIPEGAHNYGKNAIDYINCVYRNKMILDEIDAMLAGGAQ